ncbi:DUF423 domain-containing protein [Aestuariispira insulae]|nr:DUF423 domain-containing protein [Aestuariispira insulae]
MTINQYAISMNSRLSAFFIFISGLFGLAAVAVGAIASHAALEPEAIKRLATASQFLFFHIPGFMICIWLSSLQPRLAALAGILFLAGQIMFSVNLILMGLTDVVFFSALTPVGGVCYMLGWAMVGTLGRRLFLTPAKATSRTEKTSRP